MLNEAEALERAKGFLEEQGPDMTSHPVRIMEEATFLDGDRLIAPWNTVDYLDHGDEMMQLGGNLPITVSLKTGECGYATWEDMERFAERRMI